MDSARDAIRTGILDPSTWKPLRQRQMLREGACVPLLQLRAT